MDTPDTVQVPATLTGLADLNLAALRRHFPADTLLMQQVMNVVTEAGELVDAYRRYAGLARRTGPWANVEAELADVIEPYPGCTESDDVKRNYLACDLGGLIAVTERTAAVLGIDVDAAWRAKSAVILNRGWKDSCPTG
jgi:hypothetical protein